MANKSLFATLRGKLLPRADAQNEAGGKAYRLTSEQALAQYAATGCLNGTFYAGADEQLSVTLKLAEKVDPKFVAQTAVFCRERGFMKDMPALLCAVLAKHDVVLLDRIFERVLDNGKMLRNFVQMIRSGVTGRKSLGSAPKRLVRRWLSGRSEGSIFRASVGNDPSLADVLKMVHPKPESPTREALYGYLIGRKYDAENLPELVRAYEDFKAGRTQEIPEVPFQFLTSLEITPEVWKRIAWNASWQMTRMNLNTFVRHGVFEDEQLVHRIAARLRDSKEIAAAKVFPYQLLAAYRMTAAGLPVEIREALQEAMEIAVGNVPTFEGRIYVCPDVSGSMRSPVTGVRKGSTTAVSCLDVASLTAAAVLRKNRQAEVLPFSDNVVPVQLNPRDSIATNAEKLAGLPSGGTCCSAPLAELNRRRAHGEFVLMVSDNQSWVETLFNSRGPTETLNQWAIFKHRNPHARLACVDLQPSATTQAQEREDILNIGGFSDQVFEVLSEFARGTLTGEHWVGVIKSVKL
jgi:60 kDa SS-A/Ro ribonucleoprotein